ncbi:MAG: hypothetical protein Tsb0020_51260 [Haliangiales bacterium]
MPDSRAHIFIDHLQGRYRGQRQVFNLGVRVRFGRHPESEVAFHPERDLDASSRHAELCPAEQGVAAAVGADVYLESDDELDLAEVSDTAVEEFEAPALSRDALARAGSERAAQADAYTIRDVGSSNGTYVDGELAIEAEIPLGRPVEIAFGGDGGPRVRLFIGPADRAPPPLPHGVERAHAALRRYPRAGAIGLFALLVVLAVVAWGWLV